MANVISHDLAIKNEMDAARAEWRRAQHAFRLDKSMARREHRRPDPKFARAWIDAESKIDSLRIERKLYANSYSSAGQPPPSEFQEDAAARVLLGPHYPEYASSKLSDFPRPP